MESMERSRVYDFARRNGLREPYDFAIHNEDRWDDRSALCDAARSWEHRHLTDRKARVEDEIEQLQGVLENIEANLAAIDTKEYGT